MHVPIRPKRRGQFRPNGSTARQQRNVDPWGGASLTTDPWSPLPSLLHFRSSLSLRHFRSCLPIRRFRSHGLRPIGHNFRYVTSGLLLASGLCSVSGLLTCQHHRPYFCKANSLSGQCQTVFCVVVTVSLPFAVYITFDYNQRLGLYKVASVWSIRTTCLTFAFRGNFHFDEQVTVSLTWGQVTCLPLHWVTW